MSENKKNKLVVDDIEVIVRGTKNRPYYEIKYREVGRDDYNIGFGSYDLNNVLKWKEEEFDVAQNKETKQEVTNEQLLEHLKEIEIAQGCLANGMTALFLLIGKRKEELKLSDIEKQIIECGQIALACLAERMANISGMNEKEKMHVVGKEDVEDFLDFLKEILS